MWKLKGITPIETIFYRYLILEFRNFRKSNALAMWLLAAHCKQAVGSTKQISAACSHLLSSRAVQDFGSGSGRNLALFPNPALT